MARRALRIGGPPAADSGGGREDVQRLRAALADVLTAHTKQEADEIATEALMGMKSGPSRKCPHENITTLVDGPAACEDCGQTWLTREDVRRGPT